MKKIIDIVVECLLIIIVIMIGIFSCLGLVILGAYLFAIPIIGIIKGDYWSFLLTIIFWPPSLLCFIIAGIPFAIIHFDPKIFRQENYGV